MIPRGSILQEEGATHVRGVEPQVRSSCSCLLGHRPCSQVLQLSWVTAQIVRFSNQASWVTAPLAPGGAGRQRERLLWSCCDQGSAPAVGCLRSWRPRPGGVVRLECCRAGAAPPSSSGGGASTSPPSLESLLPPQQQMHPSWEARTTDQEYVVLNLKG